MPRSAQPTGETDAPTRPGAQAWVPGDADLGELASAATACRGCELYADAERVVFGAGPAQARAVLVGEQPGDVEDREGEPFVGPAGTLLRRALEEVGLNVNRLYLTNAVKHFRFTERGKRRLHRTPAVAHVTACRPWLAAELNTVQPDLIIVLGAIAARALLGPAFRVTRERGRLLSPEDRAGYATAMADLGEADVLATVHPSAVLRADDRERAYAEFRDDFAVAAARLRSR